MFPSHAFFCIPLILNTLVQSQSFLNEVYPSSSIDCPNDRPCAFIEDCPAIANLMSQNLLPVHRFRQAICGYSGVRVKVCCDVGSNSVNPVFTQDDALSKSDLFLECGKSFIPSDSNTVGAYPFVARIGFRSTTGEIKYPCNGAILNERTVLTTASCALAKSDGYKLHSVLVGAYDVEADPACNTQKLNVSYVIKHPNYRADTFVNNIAMLRLKEPIQYTVTAQPVCLFPRDRYVTPSMSSVLVGWGTLSSQKARICQQQALKMKVLLNEECSSYYSQGLSVELCAIGDEMPCSGYSGGPLLTKSGDAYFLLGILSYGSNCDTVTNFPSVFVNVQSYTRWMLENWYNFFCAVTCVWRCSSISHESSPSPLPIPVDKLCRVVSLLQRSDQSSISFPAGVTDLYHRE